LTKDELTAGIKKDETLHRAIIKEYNDTDKNNDDAFPHLECEGDPAIFDGPLLWTQSKKALSDLVSEYDHCYANWKKSGNHGDFDPEKDPDDKRPIPFSRFVQGNHSLLCTHEYVYAFPNIFEKIAVDLPPRAFRESIASTEPGANTTPPPVARGSAKKKKKLTSARQDRMDIEEHDSQMKKNSAVSFHMFQRASDKASATYRDMKDKREAIFAESIDKSDSTHTRSGMKKRFREYKKKKLRRSKKKPRILLISTAILAIAIAMAIARMSF